MGQRSEALLRILAFFYGGFFASILAVLVMFIGLIWAVVDILVQLILDRNLLSEESRPARVVVGVLHWNISLLIFALTGSGSFEWLPSL